MRGTVDSAGRALLTVALRANHRSPAVQLEVWIDTGFTGDLVIPQAKIDALGLSQSGSVDAVLADGSQTELNTFSCIINWFGSERNLEVIANDGAYPLLGVGLLLGLEFRVDYHKFVLTLAPPVRP
jgi:clan AA aspartic protease